MRLYEPLGVSPADVVSIAGDVISDPCFGDVLTQLKRIRAAHKASSAPAVPSPYPTPSTPGVGLCKIRTPLKTYADLVEKGSWVPGAVVLGAIAGVFALGYWSGKGSGKGRR